MHDRRGSQRARSYILELDLRLHTLLGGLQPGMVGGGDKAMSNDRPLRNKGHGAYYLAYARSTSNKNRSALPYSCAGSNSLRCWLKPRASRAAGTETNAGREHAGCRGTTGRM